MKQLSKQVIFYGVLIGLWVLLAALKIWPPYVFPTPQGVFPVSYTHLTLPTNREV